MRQVECSFKPAIKVAAKRLNQTRKERKNWVGQMNIIQLVLARLYRLTYPCDKYFFIDKLSMKILAYPILMSKFDCDLRGHVISEKESERWKVWETRKSTKIGIFLIKYTLSSSYSRLKQIWFPHSHTFTQRKNFHRLQEKFSLYRIF